MSSMQATELVNRALDIVLHHKTLYVSGCFGAPMSAKNKQRYRNNNAYNRQKSRVAMIQAASDDTFGFDCVCLIKGILWGFSGDKNKTYGGAAYRANDVPDINQESMIAKCTDVSTDFTHVPVGAMLWMPGHCGIYVGGGLAVECTPKWANGVQITAVANIGKKAGYPSRQWTKWGRLPWVEYDNKAVTWAKSKGLIDDEIDLTATLTVGQLVNILYGLSKQPPLGAAYDE